VLLLAALCVIGWASVSAAQRYPELYPPKPPHYGAWAVEELTGAAGPYAWRRVAFQEPGALHAELAIGAVKRFPTAAFSFEEPEPGVLVVEGRGIRAKLRRMTLSSPWFHWILGPDLE
jgi:hypothetical protein